MPDPCYVQHDIFVEFEVMHQFLFISNRFSKQKVFFLPENLCPCKEKCYADKWRIFGAEWWHRLSSLCRRRPNNHAPMWAIPKIKNVEQPPPAVPLNEQGRAPDPHCQENFNGKPASAKKNP
jgi:hypothetical protein